jgi:hypothetical protein
MIIIPSKKFIFLRVPKTASTSISQFLGEKLYHIPDMKHTPVMYSNFYTDKCIELSDIMQPHINLQEMIYTNFIDKNLINSSRVFGVVRDPVERFVSCASALYFYNKDIPGAGKWLTNIREVQKKTFNLDIELLVNDTFEYFKNIDLLILRKQTYWLKFEEQLISDIFLYQEIDKLTSSVFNYLNINNTDFIPYQHRSNERPNKKFNLSKQLKTKIIEHYLDDYELYHRLISK